MKRAIRSVLVLTLVATTACSPGGGDDVAAGSEGSSESLPGPPPVETWTMSAQPILEIGVVSGDEQYQFDDVRDAALLPDGGVVVANSGSSEVRVFDGNGAFVLAQGGEGDGPGEWRSIGDVEVLASDSVAVVDGRNRRVGYVDRSTGEYLGEASEEEAERFATPTLWFHDGLLVDAELDPAQRGVLLPVLDQLDVTDPSAPIFVRLDEEGRVWVKGAPSAPSPLIRVFDLDGNLRDRLELPAGFTLFELTPDRVLGVWRDELDVEYVRLHALEGRGPFAGPQLGGKLSGDVPALPTTPDPTDELREKVRAPFIAMATSQEIHYSQRYRYSTDLAVLEELRPMELSPDIRVDILFANSGGWAARFIDLPTGGGCFLSYGSGIRVEEMPPGSLNCWGG